nr:uncharacterized protein LOC109155910 isoform X1 [Ipomoea batatas]GMD35103.1 uncharacterized protein LOC109155910 isoform X1 [Ipomoea batatas]
MATSLAMMTARRAAAFNRIPTSGSAAQAASFVPRRGLAGAADHHGPPKVNFWSDPTSPSKWKEEHVSIPLSLLRHYVSRCNFNLLRVTEIIR